MARKNALILTCGEYKEPGFPTLLSASQDARRLRAALERPRIGDFQVHQVDDPSLVEAQAAVYDLLSRAEADDLVFIYISGHGVKDAAGRFYVALPASRPEALPATAFSGRYLRDQISDTASQRVVVVLDTCYAGAFNRDLLSKSLQLSGGIPEELTDGGRGHAVLAASRAAQFAFENVGEDTYSVFTSAMCDGLESGDADLDEDGWITLQELHHYVGSCLIEQGILQTPELSCFGVTGDLRLTRAPSRSVGLADEDVRQALASIHPELRRGAVEVLSKFGRSRNSARREFAIAELGALANDSNPTVRLDAQYALSDLPRPTNHSPEFSHREQSAEPAAEAWVQLSSSTVRAIAGSLIKFITDDELLPAFHRVWIWAEEGTVNFGVTNRYQLDLWQVRATACSSQALHSAVSAHDFVGLAQLRPEVALRIEDHETDVEFSTADAFAAMSTEMPPSSLRFHEFAGKTIAQFDGTPSVTLSGTALIDAIERVTKVPETRSKWTERRQGSGWARVALSLDGALGVAGVSRPGELPLVQVELEGDLVAEFSANANQLAAGLAAFTSERVELKVLPDGKLLSIASLEPVGAVHRHIMTAYG